MSGYSVLGGLRCCGLNWVDIGEESSCGRLVCTSPYVPGLENVLKRNKIWNVVILAWS